MLNFMQNIWVDGDEFTRGFLGLDWLPTPQSSQAKQRYETGVLGQLRQIFRTNTGMIVITEIAQLAGRRMFIRPYHPSRQWGRCNATATPTDSAAATLRGTTVPDRDGRLPALRQPHQTGTGTGSDTVINYSPETFAAGSTCPTGPGTPSDEMLLHEMIHGLRHMAGRSVQLEQITGNPGMDNYEEFVAILISNIYRSERGVTQLRRDHRGFNVLTDATSNSATFRTTYAAYISNLRTEQPRLVAALAAVGGAFNPLHN